MKKPVLSYSFRERPGARSLISAAAFTTMLSTAHAGQNIVDVKVYFDANCPAAVDNWVPTVGKSPPERVRWTAYEQDGTTQKTDAQYDIYFDPFVGPSPTAKSGGIVESQPVSSSAPSNVLYKYTIVAPGCAPLDPYIRIQ